MAIIMCFLLPKPSEIKPHHQFGEESYPTESGYGVNLVVKIKSPIYLWLQHLVKFVWMIYPREIKRIVIQSNQGYFKDYLTTKQFLW